MQYIIYIYIKFNSIIYHIIYYIKFNHIVFYSTIFNIIKLQLTMQSFPHAITLPGIDLNTYCLTHRILVFIIYMYTIYIFSLFHYIIYILLFHIYIYYKLRLIMQSLNLELI